MARQNHAAHADSKVIWFNGELIPFADATVHILSHSLQYGGAVFEGIRAYKTDSGRTAIFRGEAHFERFLDSLKPLGYQTKFTVTDLMTASRAVIKENGFAECYIRPTAFLDDASRGLKLPSNPMVTVAIAAWDWGKYLGSTAQTAGIRLMTSSFRRPDPASSFSHAKLSGGYLSSVLARREATLNGFDEGLLLDPDGFVAEGSGENIFIVNRGRLITPPTGYILPGITRSSVVEIAQKLGFEVAEERITRNQLYLADEAFFTGTAVEVTPIAQVDHRPIGTGKPGPITQEISQEFFSAVHGKQEHWKAWLTLV